MHQLKIENIIKKAKLKNFNNISTSTIIQTIQSSIKRIALQSLKSLKDIVTDYNQHNESISIFQIKKVTTCLPQAPTNHIHFNKAIFIDPSLKYHKSAIHDNLPVYLASQINPLPFLRVTSQLSESLLEKKNNESEQFFIFKKYYKQVGTIIPVKIKSLGNNNIIVSLVNEDSDKLTSVEGIITKTHMSQEHLRIGDNILALIINVLPSSSGPQIILSRRDKKFLSTLLIDSIPEIKSNTIIIHSIARDSGVRSKIAVFSKSDYTDPIGSCIGAKGEKIQPIIQELKGEKLDIIPFEKDDAQFVCNALAPATISRVLVNETNHSMQVFVSEDQLSLAIGRNGINVKLASILTGWHINIHSNNETPTSESLYFEILNLDPSQTKILHEIGFKTVIDMSRLNWGKIKHIPNLNLTEHQILNIKRKAKKILELKKNNIILENTNTNLDLLTTNQVTSQEDIDALRLANYNDLIDIVIHSKQHIIATSGLSSSQVEKILTFTTMLLENNL